MVPWLRVNGKLSGGAAAERVEVARQLQELPRTEEALTRGEIGYQHAVAMARAQDPDSAGSQFYICLEAAPFLDGNYTVFGQVVEGMEYVEQIKIGDKMEKVTIE